MTYQYARARLNMLFVGLLHFSWLIPHPSHMPLRIYLNRRSSTVWDRRLCIGPRLSLTHTQNKHLLNQATIPKPPTLPNLIYPSSVFPLTLPPNCIVLQIQNPSCRLPTKVALDTHSAHTHTLQNTRTMELKGPSGMNEAWERGTGRMKEGDSNERDWPVDTRGGLPSTSYV